MMGRTHLIVSTGITLSVLHLADQHISAPDVAAAAISSLLPDIDEPNSLLYQRTLSNRFIQTVKILLVISGIFLLSVAPSPVHCAIATGLIAGSFISNRLLRKLCVSTAGVLLLFFGQSFEPWNYIAGVLLTLIPLLSHRGMTHTLYGVILWTGILYAATHSFDELIWIAGGISYTIHLLCDALTNTGIRPLPPFKWRLKLSIMTTGRLGGKFIESIFVISTGLLVCRAFM